MQLSIKSKKKILSLALVGGLIAYAVPVCAQDSGMVSTSYGNTTIHGNGIKSSSLVTFGGFISDPDDVAYTGQIWAYAGGVTSTIYTVRKGVPLYSKKFHTSSSKARIFVNVNGQNAKSCELTD